MNKNSQEKEFYAAWSNKINPDEIHHGSKLSFEQACAATANSLKNYRHINSFVLDENFKKVDIPEHYLEYSIMKKDNSSIKNKIKKVFEDFNNDNN